MKSDNTSTIILYTYFSAFNCVKLFLFRKDIQWCEIPYEYFAINLLFANCFFIHNNCLVIGTIRKAIK